MQITTETFGNVVVVHTPDDLMEETARLVADTVDGHLRRGNADIVLQMDRTDGYDSVGLATLLELQDQARLAGGAVKISGLVDPGRKILEITRLDKRFDIFDSVIDAVASFQ